MPVLLPEYLEPASSHAGKLGLRVVAAALGGQAPQTPGAMLPLLSFEALLPPSVRRWCLDSEAQLLVAQRLQDCHVCSSAAKGQLPQKEPALCHAEAISLADGFDQGQHPPLVPAAGAPADHAQPCCGSTSSDHLRLLEAGPEADIVLVAAGSLHQTPWLPVQPGTTGSIGLPAHQCMLRASPYFEALLSGRWALQAQGQQQPWEGSSAASGAPLQHLKLDCGADAAAAILVWLYTGRLCCRPLTGSGSSGTCQSCCEVRLSVQVAHAAGQVLLDSLQEQAQAACMDSVPSLGPVCCLAVLADALQLGQQAVAQALCNRIVQQWGEQLQTQSFAILKFGICCCFPASASGANTLLLVTADSAQGSPLLLRLPASLQQQLRKAAVDAMRTAGL